MSDSIQPLAMYLIPAAVALGAVGRAYLAHRRRRLLCSAADPVEGRVPSDGAGSWLISVADAPAVVTADGSAPPSPEAPSAESSA